MTQCPLCHKRHDDSADLENGRVRVCIACYTGLHQTFVGLPGARSPNPQGPKPKAPAEKAAKNKKGS